MDVDALRTQRQRPVLDSTPRDASANDIFPENKWGELGRQESNYDSHMNGGTHPNGNPFEPPVETDGNQNAPNETFSENKWGELGRADSNVQEHFGNSTAAPPLIKMPRSDEFGEDTAERSQQWKSDKIYQENQFGEIRSDSTVVEKAEDSHVPLKSRLKGTAEQVLGKITGNEELHNKGISRKNSPNGLVE